MTTLMTIFRLLTLPHNKSYSAETERWRQGNGGCVGCGWRWLVAGGGGSDSTIAWAIFAGLFT